MPEANSTRPPALPSLSRPTPLPGTIAPAGDEPLSPGGRLSSFPARPLHPLFLPGNDLPPGNTGTVLLVETDDAVRAVAARVLGEAGYVALAVANADQALRAAEEKGPVHLLVADLSVPEAAGGELAGRLARCTSDVQVLYLSVYPSEVVGAGAALLVKPFGAAELLQAVRQALAHRAPAAP
jgi:two-component system cell cycle response regulator CpdR